MPSNVSHAMEYMQNCKSRCGEKNKRSFHATTRLSTGASRESPVDNECLGKSRQVGGSGESWIPGTIATEHGYWQLG